MPEMPEVESLVRWLRERTRGLTVVRADVLAISALKTFDPPLGALVGRVVGDWSRRGKFLVCRLDPTAPPADNEAVAPPPGGVAAAAAVPLYCCIHLARAGWLKWSDAVAGGPAKLTRGPQAFRLAFSDGSGFVATEAGTDKRLQVHVVRDPNNVEQIRTLGVDAMDASFTADALGALLAAHGRAQVKGVITDQSVIAGIGNAYSDEALHAARMSPFKQCASFTPDDTRALRDAIVAMLTEAVDRSAGKPAAELKDAKRSGLRVHARTGQPCPVCGDTVREVAFASKSLQYCATCQTGGKPLADRRLSRLLK